MQDLLGRGRRADLEGGVDQPPAAALEQLADEGLAADVGEQELGLEERRQVAGVVERRGEQAAERLLGGEVLPHVGVHERRGAPLVQRRAGERAIVGGRAGLEPEALVLQRVRELVGEDHLLEHARARAGALHHAQPAVARVVVARHALAEQVAAQLAQVGAGLDQPEQLVDGLVVAAALGRVVAVDALQPLAAGLLGGHLQRLRQLVEAQAAQRLHAPGDDVDRRGGLRRRLLVLGEEPEAEERDDQHRDHRQGRPHP